MPVGATVTVTAAGVDRFGEPTGDVTGQVTLTSDVPTDVIAGNTVTFLTASPHTITATHPTGATGIIVITVNPAPAEVAPTPVPVADALAVTGADQRRWLVAGLVGAAVLFSGLRRRVSPDRPRR